MTEACDVLVAGGGIAGLAVLRELHRAGISAMALERRATPEDAGLAINLPGNAIAALRGTGLGEALEKLGAPVSRREYRSDRGRLLFAVDEAAFWGPALTPRCVRRGDLAALLAQDLPADAVRRDAAVASIEGGAGAITVRTTQGTAFSGRLLVGADGIHSAVRRLRFGAGAAAPARLASSSWRFMAPNPGIHCWTVWAGAEAMFLLLPLDRNEVYGWAAATKDRAEASEPGILRDLSRGFPAPVREAVEAALSGPARMHTSPLEEIRLDRWSRDGVILIGDAAHATAPVWAQGAALALEDAAVLAELLAAGGDWNEVGERFEQRRRPRVAHVQDMTDRTSRAARLPIALRNLLMPFVGPRIYRATYGALKPSATAV